MENLECLICKQDFSTQIGLEKHLNTNKHKTNNKIKKLTDENNILKQDKSEIISELNLAYQEMNETKMKLDKQKYDHSAIIKKVDITLARLDEITNMIKWDIDDSKNRYKEIIKLIDDNKQSNNIFNFKTLLITGIAFSLSFLVSTNIKV